MTIKFADTEFDHWVYDEAADVLYLSVGEPRAAARTDASREGHALRYDEAGTLIGLTLVNAAWLLEQEGRITVSPPSLELDRSAVEAALGARA